MTKLQGNPNSQIGNRGKNNPKGVASSSPGLRGTSYPGSPPRNFPNPKGVAATVIHCTNLPSSASLLLLCATYELNYLICNIQDRNVGFVIDLVVSKGLVYQ